jgi:hypothetical protein
MSRRSSGIWNGSQTFPVHTTSVLFTLTVEYASTVPPELLLEVVPTSPM